MDVHIAMPQNQISLRKGLLFMSSHKFIYRGTNVICRRNGKTLLQNISFKIPESGIYTILGPSGAGKTTFLILLNAMDPYDEGSILYQGKELSQIDISRLRREVGIVFQIPYLIPGIVKENLKLALKWRKDLSPLSQKKIEEVLHAVFLPPDIINHEAQSLSVGEQQRVCIARTLLTSPKVILMDEPTSALDPTASQKIIELVQRLRDLFRISLVFVTHRIDYARQISDWVCLLKSGKIVEESKASQFFEHSQNPITLRFLNHTLE
jgi:putative ABC transport system ATP-binding protein